MTTLICNCNKTMPLDGPAITQALTQALGPDAGAGLQAVHSTLCRREAGEFQRAARTGEPLLVACTQESRLFLELNEQTEGAPGPQVRPIRFVNIREMGGWSRDAAEATPKIAALIAMAQLPEPPPVPAVAYESHGRLLIIGSADRAARAAAMLADHLDVSLLLQGPGTLPQQRDLPAHAGRVTGIRGWLGAFEVAWESANPIDLNLCTRCNACIDVCPEGAIDFSYQIDLDKCRDHRDCVRACTAAGAIDFQRAPQLFNEPFDLVLDLNPAPLMALHQPPQGYFHAADDAALVDAVLELRDSTGEFEKPRFFDYQQRLCAHSRNERIGCTACIDVCSAQAIRSDASLKGRSGHAGGPALPGILVEPHLCVGCGACTTVCPSGAIAYATPRTDHQGRRLKTLLATYRKAGGRDAALLVHSQQRGSQLIGELGRAARTDARVRGVPARCLPLEVWHTASVGMDLWLSAIAFGASQVLVLMTGEEAPDYRRAVAAQMDVAQAILTGLGFEGRHLHLIQADDALALDQALALAPAAGVAQPASFAVSPDKRTALELAIEHLRVQAASAVQAIALPAEASPFGNLLVDPGKCTMCLSCVSACPASALADNAEKPQLRFIEKNCVQCGLCATTCPEQAITLQPRLLLADEGKARKQTRVLHEVEPYRCIRCGKAFGTVPAIELMIAKLGSHAMFQGAGAARLRMCGDCRVIDLHTNPDEVRITDV